MSRLLSDWMLLMPEANENSALNAAANNDNASLQRAFQTFIEASQHLELAYEELQQKVQGLTDELAVANGELRRQYAEKALLSQRLQILLESLPAGVVEIAADGRVAALNPTGVAMLGESVRGCSWAEVRLAHFASTFNPEEWLLRDEGESRVVNLAEQPLPDGSGSIVLVHDVTTAHGLQQQLEHHKRLSAMGKCLLCWPINCARRCPPHCCMLQTCSGRACVRMMWRVLRTRRWAVCGTLKSWCRICCALCVVRAVGNWSGCPSRSW